MTHLIYDVDEAMGSVHDFTLCKTSLLLLAVCWAMVILADSGYQGIQDYHEWSLIPKGRCRIIFWLLNILSLLELCKKFQASCENLQIFTTPCLQSVYENLTQQNMENMQILFFHNINNHK